MLCNLVAMQLRRLVTKRKSINLDTFDGYKQALKDLLKPLGDRRFAEQQLARKIESDFANDISFTFKERRTLLQRAEKMLQCRTTGVHGVKSGRLVTGWDHKCSQVRLCPDESRAEGARLGAKYLPPMSQLMARHDDMRCYYMVLTTPNVSRAELRKEKRAIFARWKKMMDRQRKKSGIDIGGGTIEAAFLAQEDPLSATGLFNVHVNAIIFVRGGFDYGKMRAEWGFNVEIKQLQRDDLERSMLEVVKYSVKHISGSDDTIDPLTGETIKGAPGLSDFPSADFAAWWKAGMRFRRVRGYGALYGLPDDEAEDPEEADQQDQAVDWRGDIRWKERESRYVVRHKPADASKSQPADAGDVAGSVDLIMGDKCGKPRPASLSRGVAFSKDPEIEAAIGAIEASAADFCIYTKREANQVPNILVEAARRRLLPHEVEQYLQLRRRAAPTVGKKWATS